MFDCELKLIFLSEKKLIYSIIDLNYFKIVTDILYI